MATLGRWWVRLAAAVTAMVCTVLVPAAAWAADNDVIVEAVRVKRRSRFGSFFFIGSGVCCLLVVAAIVTVILVIMRRRRR